MRPFRYLGLLVPAMLAPAAAHAAGVTVTPIPFSPEALAGNATIAYGSPGNSLMKWTPDGGAVEVASFDSLSATGFGVTSVSDDGAVVGGWFRTGANTFAPFLWSTSGGIQAFPPIPSSPAPYTAVSGNGLVAVTDNSQLLPGPVTPFNYRPRAANFDGSVIGVRNTGGVAKQVVNGVEQTIQIPGDTSTTLVGAVTPDGSVSAGITNDDILFIWSGSNLATYPITHAEVLVVNDISADGRIIVASDPTFGDAATLVFDGHMVLVEDFLAINGQTTAITRFDHALGISNDGSQFILGGVAGAGAAGALITIPEPATGLIAAALLAPALLGRRPRRTRH